MLNGYRTKWEEVVEVSDIIIDNKSGSIRVNDERGQKGEKNNSDNNTNIVNKDAIINKENAEEIKTNENHSNGDPKNRQNNKTDNNVSRDVLLYTRKIINGKRCKLKVTRTRFYYSW